MILIPLIVSIFVVYKAKRFYTGVLICCIACACAVFLNILSAYLISGQDIISYNLSSMKDMLDQNPDLARMIYFSGNLELQQNVDIMGTLSGIDIAVATRYTTDIMTPIMTELVPMLYAGCIPIGGLLFYTIIRAIVKKSGREVPDVPKLRDLHLPKQFGRWSIGFMILVFIGELLGWRNFDFVKIITFSVFGVIYTVLGLAMTAYLTRNKKAGIKVIAFIVVLILTLFIQLLFWLGIFEQIFKVRKRQEMLNKNE